MFFFMIITVFICTYSNFFGTMGKRRVYLKKGKNEPRKFVSFNNSNNTLGSTLYSIKKVSRIHTVCKESVAVRLRGTVVTK